MPSRDVESSSEPTPSRFRWNAVEIGAWSVTFLLLWLQGRRTTPAWIRNYGTDLFFPPFVYLSLRGNRTLLRRLRPAPPGPLAAAALVFAAGVGWEYGQKYGLFHGTFDPLDLVA